MVSCGKHCTTMQIGTVSRLRFCRRSWGFKIDLRRTFVHFRKSYVRASKLDVQETNLSFAPFNRIGNYFFGRRIEVGRYTRLDLWDLIVAVLHGNTNQNNQERDDPCTNLREVRSTPHTIHKRKQSQRVINELDNVDFISSNVNSSRQEALLYVFEDNEALTKMIIKGRSPTMRDTCPAPAELLLTGCLTESNWMQSSNQICRHQTPTRRLNDKRANSHVISWTTCCISLISWTTPHFPVATFTSILCLSAGKQSEMSTRSQESSSLCSPKVKAKACCLVSRQCVSVGQDYSSDPQKARGVQETLKCGPGKKWKIRMVFCSACLWKPKV